MVEAYNIYSPLIDSWLDGKSTDFRVGNGSVVNEWSNADGQHHATSTEVIAVEVSVVHGDHFILGALQLE